MSQRHDIDQRYAVAIAGFDVRTGRDRNGLTPEQRRRYAALQKTNYWHRSVRTSRDIAEIIEAACDLIEAEQHVGG